jgi:hypothetical protein
MVLQLNASRAAVVTADVTQCDIPYSGGCETNVSGYVCPEILRIFVNITGMYSSILDCNTQLIKAPARPADHDL